MKVEPSSRAQFVAASNRREQRQNSSKSTRTPCAAPQVISLPGHHCDSFDPDHLLSFGACSVGSPPRWSRIEQVDLLDAHGDPEHLGLELRSEMLIECAVARGGLLRFAVGVATGAASTISSYSASARSSPGAAASS